MLWIEAASISMITIVLAALLFHTGFHLDTPQLALQSVSPSGVRLGVVLAIFSFVGFESATTLGHEARNPLRTIPRAVIQSAVLCGLFFLICSYAENLGFRQLRQDLGKSDAPFRALSALARIPLLGPLIDVCAFVSMFACTLACITAAARVLLKMAHDGLAPSPLGRAHATNETPHLAVLTTGLAVLVPAAVLSARGVSGADIYAWMGSLAVYGFLTVYFLVALALPFYLRRSAQLTPPALLLTIAAALAMLLAMAGTLYPPPTERPYTYLPYLYLAYLLAGLVWFTIARRRIASAWAAPTASS
jgi:amino acid transporter